MTPQSRYWDDSDFAPNLAAAMGRGTRRAGWILILAIASFFIVGFLWARWAVLDEVTNGEARVIPSSQIQIVQNLEGGILKEILVSEGDIVSADHVLLRIDDTAFSASYGELSAKQLALMGAVSRLTAEVEGTALQFPRSLLNDRPEIASQERALYEARRQELEASINVFRQQLEQRNQELTELRSKIGFLQQSLELARGELAITTPLAQQGVVPRVEELRLQRQVNELRRELEAARLQIPRAESAQREISRRMDERETAFRSEAQRELTQRKGELFAVSETIVAARDRVSRTEVRSPVKGIVKQIKLRTIGGVVRPGMDLIEIVPVDDTLLVEAQIRPADIAFVRPNQAAKVKITAYDYSIYGSLEAKVERISADTIVNETGPNSQRGESYYKVIVRTDRNYLGTPDLPLPIIPGMVASIDIVTGEKTVLDYLLKPINKAQSRALRER
jgi:membrane fusion protein, adhesin transport system